MTSRLLPPDEWPRLDGTELATIWPTMNPETCHIIVVEHEGVIVGCWSLIAVMHLEGVWIAPAHRKSGSVARRLLQKMRGLLGGAPGPVVTSALSEDVARLIRRLGGEPLPGTHFVLGRGV